MSLGHKREKRDGFPKEILYVVPRENLHSLKVNPALSGLCVTDVGGFPRAYGHLRRREHGCGEGVFIYCTAGKGFVSLLDKRVEVNSNDCIFIAPETPHEYGADKDDPWSIYWMHVVGDFLPIYVPLIFRNIAIPISADSREFSITLFERIFANLSRGMSSYYMITAASLASTILGEVFLDSSLSTPNRLVRGSQSIESIISYIQDNLDQPMTLAILRRQSHLSISRINQLFREMTGHAPMEFVQRQRMQRACYYLTSTTEAISYIARRVGFEDQFYFSRVFRKTIGVSPRRYRKESVSMS